MLVRGTGHEAATYRGVCGSSPRKILNYRCSEGASGGFWIRKQYGYTLPRRLASPYSRSHAFGPLPEVYYMVNLLHVYRGTTQISFTFSLVPSIRFPAHVVSSPDYPRSASCVVWGRRLGPWAPGPWAGRASYLVNQSLRRRLAPR